MSKLDELIKKICPNGVEYIQVGDITEYEQPAKYIVKSTDYSDEHDVPVLTAGQSFVLGYTNEKNGIYQASKDNAVIIFDDFTGAFKWVDFPFKVKSSAIKMITAIDDKVMLRYLYHLMGFIGLTSSEHKRLWISIYSAIKVPLPPLEVQREIVHILDSFTLLTAELTAELTARKKQYEYYRDELLTPSKENIEKVELSDVVNIKNGKDYKHLKEGIYPVYGSGGIMTYVSDYAYDKPSVLIPRKGSLNNLYYVEEPFWNVDTVFYTEINTDRILPKYLYYLLQKEHLETLNIAGGVPSLTQTVLNKVKLSIPSLDTQRKIVECLDNFEQICNDLNIGLPAEIEARKKQYEYYRDLLLTFAETGKIIATDRQTDRQTDIKLVQYVFGYARVKLEIICQKVSLINWNKEIKNKYYIDLTSVSREKHRINEDEVTLINSDEAPSRAKQIIKKNDILFGGTRPMLKRYCIVNEGYDNQVCSTGFCVLRINDKLALSNYIYHVLGTTEFYAYVEMNQQGASYPAISDKTLKCYEIMLPPLEEQEKIVSILDRFDSLCNDISAGLPAEIEARKKQYEYFRDKMLSFKEISND